MMTRIWLLLLGATATMTFALVVLVILPRSLLSHVAPSPGLTPYTTTQWEGRRVYTSLGCIYCHTQQVRDAVFTADERRGWGRPSVPADYVYDEPHLIGTMRTGPDLLNVGARLPDRGWHLLHLYDPRLVMDWSIMPSFPFLFEWKAEAGPDDEIVALPASSARPNQVLVARREARDLVDYLVSLARTARPLPTGTEAP